MDVRGSAEIHEKAKLLAELQRTRLELCELRVLLWDARLEHAKSMIESSRVELERAREEAEPRC